MSKRPPKPITRKRAQEIVDAAPGGYGAEAVAIYLEPKLQEIYDEGKRDGALAERETVARSQLAFWEGVEAQARGRANEARNELNEILDALGKCRVWAPEVKR